MDAQILQDFFMWCTIINAGLLALTFVMCACAGDLMYRTHSRWFPISRQAFDVAVYSFLGLYKVLIIVLNLVPYVALVIVG